MRFGHLGEDEPLNRRVIRFGSVVDPRSAPSAGPMVARSAMDLRGDSGHCMSPPARTHHRQGDPLASPDVGSSHPRSFAIMERPIDRPGLPCNRNFKPLVLGQNQSNADRPSRRARAPPCLPVCVPHFMALLCNSIITSDEVRQADHQARYRLGTRRARDGAHSAADHPPAPVQPSARGCAYFLLSLTRLDSPQRTQLGPFAESSASGAGNVSQLLINAYLADLHRLRQVSGSKRESVIREAFKDLLKAWGKTLELQFIPEHEYITPTKERRYIDGALLYDLRVPFGYWEAKDTNDKLDDEIVKKFRRGYPQTNIIFEDSTEAVLVQNGKEITRTPVTDVDKLGKLMELFFGYQRPEIDGFRRAIVQFAHDLPAVLRALRDRIDGAYAANKPFAKAARDFLKTAKETINPSVEDADVREMLIQHILTEDIFARIFGDSDFHHENNVAKALYGLEKLFFRGDVKQEKN
jgi:hypothetical protein